MRKSAAVFLVITIAIFSSCSVKDSYKQDIVEIKHLMKKQEKDWSAGKMEGYMQAYWNSDSLRFMGVNGITCGWEKQLEKYKKAYPDKDAMGRLTFDFISFDKMGQNHMFVVGKWNLQRKKDTLNGYYSLVWKRINGHWRIIFDHTP